MPKLKRYIVIILILFGMVYIVNFWFYRSFKNQATEISNYVKERTITEISEFYKQINYAVMNTVTDDEFNTIQKFNSKNEVYRSENIHEMIKNIRNTDASTAFFRNIYLYIDGLDVVLCNSGIVDVDMFYEIEAKKYFDSYEEWIENLTNRDNNFTKNNKIIAYAFPVNNKYTTVSGKYGVIFGAFINKNSVFVRTPYVEWVNKCNIYIYDRENNLNLYDENVKFKTLPERPTFNELNKPSDEYDMYSTSFAIGDRAYSVHIVFEKDLDMNMVKRVQIVLYIMMLLLFLITVYFFYNWFVARYKPLVEISKVLGISVENVDLRLIEKPIKSMVDKNASLSKLLDLKDNNLRTFVFGKLLTGNFEGKEFSELEKYGIKFEHDGFVVVVFYFYRDSDISEEGNYELVKAFENAISVMTENDNGIPYFVPMNQYLVCVYNTKTDKDMKQLGLGFAYATKFVEKDFEFVASIAVSNMHNEYWEIPVAYTEALEVISQSELFDKSKLVFYKDIIIKNDRARFGLDDETKLTKAIRGGNTDLACEIIKDTLSKINPENKFLYANVIVGLIYSLMRISNVLMGEEYDTHKLSALLKNTDDLEALKTVLCEFAIKLCDDLNIDTKNENLAIHIRDFIQENYQHPQMSVDYICETMNYSSVYLNNMFKKKYKMTMITYLNNYRIEKAKELILSGVPIGQTAEKVGVLNVRTFNRLFQNITEMTPTEYKKANFEKGKKKDEK